jgi:flagellar assembly protein FliH
MNMFSRVLKNDTVDAKPVAWRRGMGLAKAGPLRKGQAATPAVDEGTQLRLQIAELQEATELNARQAYESGIREGQAAARKELEAGIQAIQQRLAETIAEIAGTRSDTIHRAEVDTVRLTLAIAKRILHRELSFNPNVLDSLIKAALEKLQAQEVYRVRVHPDQEELMKRCLEEAGRGQIVTVVPDPTQSAGGAVFETGRGLLDASLETQLDEIERLLESELEARS